MRRIRLLLSGRPYAFTPLDIYAEGRAALATQTPMLKIPTLIDQGQHIYDSRVIARYLQQAHGIGRRLGWEEENRLSIIDGVQDSLVVLLLSQRSGLNTDGETLYFRLQQERIEHGMAALEQMVLEGQFEAWAYPAICLYTLLDWADFRAQLKLSDYPGLKAFRDIHTRQAAVVATDPRD